MVGTDNGEAINIELLLLIGEFIESIGWAPTRQEMADYFNYKSKDSIQKRLRMLCSDRYLELGEGPRAIRLTVYGTEKIKELKIAGQGRQHLKRRREAGMSSGRLI